MGSGELESRTVCAGELEPKTVCAGEKREVPRGTHQLGEEHKQEEWS